MSITMHKYTWLLVLAFVTAMPGHSRAEALDDMSIQNMYAETGAAIADPNKTQALMMQRLDNNFNLKMNMSVVIGGQSQSSVQTFNKFQAIEDAMKSYGNSKIENYQNHIDGIQYSPDRKLAYVKDRSTSFRLTNATSPDGQMIPTHYEMSQACIDVVALGTDAILRITQSECNGAIVVKP